MTLLSATEFEDLIPGYVLGILEPDELAQVEDTLAANPQYAGQIIPFERAAALLPYAAPQAPLLRPEVRERTLALIRREPRVITRSAPVVTAPARPGFGEWLRRLFGRGWAPALAALSLVLAVGLAGRLNTTQQQLAQLQAQQATELSRLTTTVNEQAAQITTLQAANAQSNAEVSRLTTTLAQRDADVARLTTTLSQREADVTRLTTELSQRQGDINALTVQLTQAQQAAQATQQQIGLVTRANQVVSLASNDPSAGASSGRVYVTDDNRAVALIQGLPAAPAGRTYQLWGIGGPGGAAPTPMGTYAVNNQGQGTWAVDPAIVAGQFPAFGVTLEPAGGSQSPTLPILLLGQRTS